MNILLVQAKGGFMLRGTTHPICRTVMFAGTLLKQHGYNVLVNDRCIEEIQIKKLYDSFRPDAAIIFTALSSSVADSVYVSKELKKLGVTVIWAELFAGLAPELCYKTGCVDYLLYDEGIEPVLELVNAIEKGTDISLVKGVFYDNNGTVIRTPEPEAPDPALIPVTDWSLIDVKKCFREFAGHKNMLYLCASVGCPYSCGFCAFSKFSCRRRIKRPIENVLAEIDILVDNYGLDAVNFSDELLYFTEDELEKIEKFRCRKGNSFVWGGETRPALFDKDTLRKMYDAGCRWLLFGIETGSVITREMINKPLDYDKIRQVVDWCTEIGIETYGSFIIGFPGETKEQLRDTVKLALSLNLDAFLFNYLIPVLNTTLYDVICDKKHYRIDDILDYEKLISPDNYDTNFSDVPMRDLAVIKSYFDFLTITRNKKNSGGKSVRTQFIRKAFNTVIGFFKGNPRDIIFNIILVVKRGISVVLYPVIFRKTVRKYGMYNVNKIKVAIGKNK